MSILPGHLIGTSSLETTFKTRAELEVPDDPLRLAGHFAARDAAGSGLGVLSPRDTARATVQGSRLEVDYSRPARRGRVVFGDVVPYGAMWRAGADAATQLTLDRDIVVQGQRIPAGRYSVWIVPRQEGDTLLLNAQTGQWGTQHDASQDRFRLAAGAGTARDQALERFGIRIEATPAGGVLHFEWDTDRLRFAVRNRAVRTRNESADCRSANVRSCGPWFSALGTRTPFYSNLAIGTFRLLS